MTRAEAVALMNVNKDEAPVVTIGRSYAEWEGRVVGVVDSPALILQQLDGSKAVIVLDGAVVASRDEQQP